MSEASFITNAALPTHELPRSTQRPSRSNLLPMLFSALPHSTESLCCSYKWQGVYS